MRRANGILGRQYDTCPGVEVIDDLPEGGEFPLAERNSGGDVTDGLNNYLTENPPEVDTSGDILRLAAMESAMLAIMGVI